MRCVHYDFNVHIIVVLEMLLVVVELQQLPLLLLLKLHIHQSCAGAAAVVVRHRMPDDAIFVAVFSLQLIPVFLFLCSKHDLLT